ncbi:MAG: type II toxin-antitoxin system VapC family toxin [Syntrophorhabdales bacterium]|jgi:ribonuclease VapC
MAETYVFDSYALFKVFQKEEGYEKVVGLLRDISASGGRALMSAINYGEIIYIIKRAFGDQKKIECLGAIERLGIEILSVPNELIFKAAEYKAEFGMSYADCFALASAVENRAAVVTGDREFGRVEGRIAVVWV